jgi:hypothetical protein
MNNENDFGKMLSNYFICLLSFIALYFIAAPVKHYLIRPGDPMIFGRIAVIILFGATFGFFLNVHAVSSKEVISPARVNRWIFVILFYIGSFFLFISLS